MIRLYKCYSCWYIFDEVLVRSGKHTMCPCGDVHFKQVNPTLFNIIKYVLFQKKHALKRIWEKEHE